MCNYTTCISASIFAVCFLSLADNSPESGEEHQTQTKALQLPIYTCHFKGLIPR